MPCPSQDFFLPRNVFPFPGLFFLWRGLPDERGLGLWPDYVVGPRWVLSQVELWRSLQNPPGFCGHHTRGAFILVFWRNSNRPLEIFLFQAEFFALIICDKQVVFFQFSKPLGRTGWEGASWRSQVVHPMCTSVLFHVKKQEWEAPANLGALFQTFMFISYLVIEILEKILLLVDQVMWATSWGVSDTYLAISIHPNNQKYLFFLWMEKSSCSFACLWLDNGSMGFLSGHATLKVGFIFE